MCNSKPRSRLVASKRGEDGSTYNCCLILSRPCQPAPCNCVIYGVIRMEFFQLALKSINICGRKNTGGRSSTTPHLP